MYQFIAFALFITACNADLLSKGTSRGATLKPLSVCCDIPEIGELQHLTTCTARKVQGPCNDVQCVFQESGFLIDTFTLNKEAYKNHLTSWGYRNEGWSVAVDKAINDCVDTDPRQHLDHPCKAYDVFACTGIALLKKCPNDFWKC